MVCCQQFGLDKTKIIKFVTNSFPQSAFGIGYKENYVEDKVNKKIPCFTKNNQVKCKNISDQSKEMNSRNEQCYAVMSVFNISDTGTLISV
jgi:hypothetical protein